MYKTLSKKQKLKYVELSGAEYIGSDLQGTFMTSRPYNSQKYKLSPWNFSYIFDDINGYLVCELAHRMTNNRIYGWDYEGNVLSNDITSHYFKSEIEQLKIINRK